MDYIQETKCLLKEVGATYIPYHVPGIYAIYCTEKEDYYYIGQSKNICERLGSHKRDLQKEEHDNQRLQNTYNKYGEESFEAFVIEYCEADELGKREDYWVNTIGFDNTYNIQPTNYDFNYNMSSTAINKIKKARKKQDMSWRNIPVLQLDMKGNLVKEHESITAASNYVTSSKGMSNIQACCNLKKKTAYGYRWMYKDKDRRPKESWIPHKGVVNKVKIKRTCINTGEQKIFNSMKEAALSMGNFNKRKSIRLCCQNKHPFGKYAGYRWEYLD